MSYERAVARNPRLLFWSNVFLEVQALAVVVTLFYMHRGLSIDEIYYLSIIWSAVSLLTEVPSGYLADYIGRKKTLVLSGLFYVIANSMIFFAFGFWQVALTFVFLSLGFSCRSGTDQAMLYNSLLDIGKHGEMVEKNARLHASKFVARIFVPVLGSYIARDLLEEQFRVLIVIDILASMTSVVILMFLVEPKIRLAGPIRERNFVAMSISAIRKDPLLLKVTFSRLIVFFAGFFVYRIYQPYLKDYGATVLMIGIFYLISRTALFAIHWHVACAAKRLGLARVINGSVILAIPFLLLSIVFSNPWLLMAMVGLSVVLMDVRETLYAKLINERIESQSRSTTLSTLNMVKGVLDIPLLLLAGRLAVMDLRYVFLAAVVLCLIALFFFRARETDFAARGSH